MIKVVDKNFGRKIDYASYKEQVAEINKMIEGKTGPGNDYLGWLNYPTNIKEEELDEIQKYAEIVRKNYDILLTHFFVSIYQNFGFCIFILIFA